MPTSRAMMRTCRFDNRYVISRLFLVERRTAATRTVAGRSAVHSTQHVARTLISTAATVVLEIMSVGWHCSQLEFIVDLIDSRNNNEKNIASHLRGTRNTTSVVAFATRIVHRISVNTQRTTAGERVRSIDLRPSRSEGRSTATNTEREKIFSVSSCCYWPLFLSLSLSLPSVRLFGRVQPLSPTSRTTRDGNTKDLLVVRDERNVLGRLIISI
jgi:hypothetical protein